MKELNPAKVQYLVIHCTATNPRQRLTPQMLELMHKAKGWETAGYHYYITTSAFVLACSGDIPPESTTRLLAALVAGGMFAATA